MPEALERKLKKEYPNNPHAVYGTLNKIEHHEKIPRMSETVHGWARGLAKQIYGKSSPGSLAKSKRRVAERMAKQK
jgi:hypothetical protein